MSQGYDISLWGLTMTIKKIVDQLALVLAIFVLSNSPAWPALF